MNYKNLSNKNICVSIANKTYKETEEIVKNTELVELRLDLLNLDFSHLEQLFKTNTKFIVTYRLGAFINEQGSSFLKNIIDLGADYIDIDIEIENGNKYIDDLISYAKNTKCKIILSYHNFEHTPKIDDLQKIINSAKKQNADYVKIATQAITQTDVAIILSLYEKNDKIIAFCMGEIGRISRVACLYLGAEFTYVSTEDSNKTAPGQLNSKQMNDIFNII